MCLPFSAQAENLKPHVFPVPKPHNRETRAPALHQGDASRGHQAETISRNEGPKSSQVLTLSIKIAQKPYIIGSLGPKALKYESFEGKG